MATHSLENEQYFTKTLEFVSVVTTHENTADSDCLVHLYNVLLGKRSHSDHCSFRHVFNYTHLMLCFPTRALHPCSPMLVATIYPGLLGEGGGAWGLNRNSTGAAQT